MTTEFRPLFHLSPENGWLNDPNGLIHADGVYHFCYQYRPEPECNFIMYWAHATSSDMLTFTHEAPVLAPDAPYDINGCWSGSAIMAADGRMVLAYTGRDENDNQAQCMAFSVDKNYTRFEKYIHNPVAMAPEGISAKDFRDPKLWEHNGRFYMAVACSLDGKGAVMVYESVDLKSWTQRGPAAVAQNKAYMWECPDIFRIDDRDFVLYSAMGDGFPTAAMGRLDYRDMQFAEEKTFRLDWGPDFYAPQTFEDDKGRRILAGWMSNWDDASSWPTVKYGWTGLFTIPRHMRVNAEGDLIMKPVDEICRLYTEEWSHESLLVEQGTVFPLNCSGSECMDIECKINFKKELACIIAIRQAVDKSEMTRIILDGELAAIILDRDNSGIGPGGRHHLPVPEAIGRELTIRLIVDTCSVELFVDNGRKVLSAVIFPTNSDNRVELTAERGNAEVSSIIERKID